MRPVVFCTDYGLADEFVGVCHGVMERIAPGVRVIDLTHAISRQDVLHGAMTLGRAVRFLPADAVVVGVVDPGVGSERRAVAVRAGDMVLVGPDNGLLSLAWDALGGASHAREITATEVLVHPVSVTFHGRDVFAPAGAHLAAGFDLERIGPEVDVAALQRVDLPRPMVAPGAIDASVIAVDGFGNVQLNVEPNHLEAAGLGDRVAVAGHSLRVVRTFSDLPEGVAGAIVNSQGYVTLVVNRGSAAEMLRLGRGSAVVIEAVTPR